MGAASSMRLVGIRLHDAIHSHAALMLKNGISPKVIQERLGQL
jgi:site-specific recombinase XerD